MEPVDRCAATCESAPRDVAMDFPKDFLADIPGGVNPAKVVISSSSLLFSWLFS